MAPRITNPTVTVSPNVKVIYGESRVSVYRDRRGNLYVRQYGEKLTRAEQRKGLTRADSKLARSVRQFYSDPENLGYRLNFTKAGGGIERTKYLRPATIDGRKGWFDTRNGKFLFKEQTTTRINPETGKPWLNAQGENFTQYGTMQLNLRSVDSTTYGLMQRESLEDFYLSWLNAKEKARLNEALNSIDWENDVYAHFVSSNPDEINPTGRPKPDEEKKGYDVVLNTIRRLFAYDKNGDPGKWTLYVESLKKANQ